MREGVSSPAACSRARRARPSQATPKNYRIRTAARHALPGSSPRTRMAVASTMRVFRACPVPDVGSSAACRGSKFHSLLKAQIPWSQGKTQGIFSIQPFFAKTCLENGYEFSSLRVNSLLKQSREFFRRAGNRREFGAKTDPLAPTHPIAPKCFLMVDKKILNTGCGYGRTRLASPDRPRLGCACRAPDQIRGRS